MRGGKHYKESRKKRLLLVPKSRGPRRLWIGKPYALVTSGNPKLLKTDLAAEPCKETNPTNEDDGLQIPCLATEDKKKVSTQKKHVGWQSQNPPPPTNKTKAFGYQTPNPKTTVLAGC